MNNETDEIDPLDAFLAEEVSPLPVGPDGGFMPQLPIQPEPIPQATPETMVCLRDCRYYLEVVSLFKAGNSKGTLGYQPKQINRFCRAIPGDQIDLTDELVSECSDWDPIPVESLTDREKRRKDWFNGERFANSLLKEGK